MLGGDRNRNDTAGALHKAWGHIFTNHIRGDYVEFGVYHGDSFLASFQQHKVFLRWLEGQLASPEDWRRKVAQKYVSSKVHFHGFDTFAGMPENSEENVTFAEGTFFSSFDNVQNKCRRAGLGDESYSLYKGLFSETGPIFSQRLSSKISILNIDCDIYSSARDALNIAGEFLQVGSVVMFDDYNAYCADNRAGERRAFREFCGKTSFKFEPWFTYQYSGQSFLCVEE